MRETVEFRIPEANAAAHLPTGVGNQIGNAIRKVVVSTDDPLFTTIGVLHAQFRAQGEFFFLGREIRRKYSLDELAAATLVHVSARKTFEPAGEECGTEYDETSACAECGAGAKQVSDLRLDLRRVPRGVDFAETIAGEQIVSQRLAECLVGSSLRGFELANVTHKAGPELGGIKLEETIAGRGLLQRASLAGAIHPTWPFWVWINRAENRPMLEKAMAERAAQNGVANKKGAPLPAWYQLLVDAPKANLIAPTRAGSDPFDTTSTGRCSRGHVVGLNLLSEVTVARASVPATDFVETEQLVGVRRGLLRPRPVLLLSAEAWQTIAASGMKGFSVEVAHLM